MLPSTPLPRVIQGRYILLAEIASGGMGSVHLARQIGAAGFSRLVAMKRLHRHLAADPILARSFLEEATLAGRVRHANVVPTLDVVADDGELFLVMEYVHGAPLSRLLALANRRHERVPLVVIAGILVGVLHGLHAAHEALDERGAPMQIVHRDVSPQNILVGADGVGRLLDFGVAKAFGSGRAHEGETGGKLAYMAPEQLRGDHVTRQADIYSAGVVLWEATVGERLFPLADEGATIMAIFEGVTARPSKRCLGVPPALDGIAMRALAPDPSRRFRTAREMAAAIEGIINAASPSQVATWFERTSRELLDERARLLVDVDHGVVPAQRSADAPPPVLVDRERSTQTARAKLPSNNHH
jgi:serine/threonine-protein kinase